MPIQFLVRKFMKESLYRKALLNLVAMEGNLLIVSTGYIHNSSYYTNATAINSLASAINKRNKIVNSKLIVKVVGGEVDLTYPNNFINFCKELYSKINDPTKIEIKFERVVSDNWHGKVVLKLEEDVNNFSNNKYYGALVGSSNLTPINILDSQFGWNLETDLYIIDGKIVHNSDLHRIKEVKCDIGMCEAEIQSNTTKIKSSIKSVKDKLNVDLPNPIIDDKIASIEDLRELREKCKEYVKDTQNEEYKYLVISILQSITCISNADRIRNEIKKAFEDLKGPGKELRTKVKNIKGVNDEIYEACNEILDSTVKLYNNKDSCTFDDFNGIYDKVKQFQKEYKENIRYNDEYAIQQCFHSLNMFKESISIIRKNLLAFKTVYDFRNDGPFIESILKGLYFETNDIIDNFCTEELCL
ncbi:hypothetical protein [Clostridium algidicarnis]|uniref:Phospholipase D-like domain-containing protein n=1 Tax=Clostridium algidicarnis TaxID=37659 RepID=A0ABS6C6I0_9CLOT|nr:hypothetical protein [Clostridium algidicarnis]MBU3221096.1 hypothetical protein [Clostridium algidicarnis]